MWPRSSACTRTSRRSTSGPRKTKGVAAEPGPQAQVGKVLERPVLEELYANPRGLVLAYPGTIRHPSEPWMGVTPDAIAGPRALVDITSHGDPEPVFIPGQIDPDRVAECKIVGPRQAARWRTEGGQLELPPEVLCQTTWQVAIVRESLGFDVSLIDVPALFGTTLEVLREEFDPEFAANLQDAARAWWVRHVEDGEMPAVEHGSARRALHRIYPRQTQGLRAMRPQVLELSGRHDGLADQIAKLQAELDLVDAKLCAEIGEREGFDGKGFSTTWKQRRGSVSYRAAFDALADQVGVDREAFLEEFRNQGTRTLRVRRK